MNTLKDIRNKNSELVVSCTNHLNTTDYWIVNEGKQVPIHEEG